IVKGELMTIRGGLAKVGDRFLPIATQTTYKVSLGAAAKPKTIDLKENKDGGRTVPGIYKFEEGKLVVCLGYAGNRPDAFESKEKTGCCLMTCERVGAGKDRKKPEGGALAPVGQDTTAIDWVLPGQFEQARARAAKENRILMIKGISFGIDAEG